MNNQTNLLDTIIGKDSVAHYTCSTHLKSILEEHRLKLSSVSRMDDPRESSMGWIESCGIGEVKVDIDAFDAFEEFKVKIGEKLKLFCASSISQEKSAFQAIELKMYGRPRMWAQYGKNSKGFCIILDRNSLDEKIRSLASQSKYVLGGKVDYCSYLPMINAGLTLEFSQGVNPISNDPFEIISQNDMLKSIFFKKNIDWRDQNEIRWLLFSEEADIFVDIKDSIKAVVLGCKFEEKEFENAIKYCKDLKCACFKLEYEHPGYTIIQFYAP
jgi:hypothetical protein